MLRLLLIGEESRALSGLCSELARRGFACATILPAGGALAPFPLQSADVVLFELAGRPPAAAVQETLRRLKASRLPLLALVPREALGGIEGYLDADDFLVAPYNAAELALRIKRLHKNGGESSGELIRCGGLVIDLDRCEVAVAGRVIELTFKEYELLRFLASNRGRVYSRDALLNRVWGHDYFGGDRTVDVHIRRLRSKIEGPKHSFIETVRNIGYRFRKGTD